MAVPEEELAEVDAWYATEHTPMLMRCPQRLAVRRFAIHGELGRPYGAGVRDASAGGASGQ
ncbi:hypothetical protein ACFU6I_15725 [Streptomyces sp. NPDC057486]|uniref:hypothetical protein n=1 Tax=Streptomyces sp. NPDC057486 TaxID=3346145 RepID=UPI0036D087DD